MNIWPHTSQLPGLNKHVCFPAQKKLEVLSAFVPINKNNKKVRCVPWSDHHADGHSNRPPTVNYTPAISQSSNIP